MFEKLADTVNRKLIVAKVRLQGRVVEPLKETLQNDDGMSELIQTLMIAGLVVVAIGAIIGAVIMPALRNSADKTANQITNFDANTYTP